PISICQMSEDQRAQNRTREVTGTDCSNLSARKMQNIGPLKNRADCSHQRDLEPVKHPRDAQPDDQQPMKPTPWKSIKTGWNKSFECSPAAERICHSTTSCHVADRLTHSSCQCSDVAGSQPLLNDGRD